jgi:hypothetical protein
LDDWHVDMSYGAVGEEIDVDGWTYSTPPMLAHNPC